MDEQQIHLAVYGLRILQSQIEQGEDLPKLQSKHQEWKGMFSGAIV
jgi:hypothetical protein